MGDLPDELCILNDGRKMAGGRPGHSRHSRIMQRAEGIMKAAWCLDDSLDAWKLITIESLG
jgi:hypothetical protein